MDIVRRFFDAYLRQRNPEKTLGCLTDDVCWIGTGAFERAGRGYRDCRALLMEEFESAPGSYPFELENLRTAGTESACYVEGDLVIGPPEARGAEGFLSVRVSAMCVERGGRCRICGVHASLPHGGKGDEGFPTVLIGDRDANIAERTRRSAFELLRDNISGGLLGAYLEDGLPVYFINDRLLKHLGYASYDAFMEGTGGMARNIVHPDDREAVDAVLIALERSDQYEVTYRMVRCDGSSVWVLERGCLTATDEGRAVLVSLLIDVDESHQLQERLRRGMEELREKNAELEAFHTALFTGMAKVLDDPDCTVISANDHFFERVGYTREEVRDRLGNSTLNLVHPDDRSAILRAVEQIRREGRCTGKFRFVAKDGEVFCVRVDACFAEERVEGRRVMYCFYTDIEDQERREADYQRQLYFLSLIGSSLAGGGFVAYAGDERRLAYVSDGLLEFLGYTREAFEEQTRDGLTALVYAEDAERSRTAWRLAVDGCYEQEYRIRTGANTSIWVLEKGRLATDEEGREVCICILLDITARKMRQDELLRQTRIDPLTGLYNREYAQQYIQTYLDIHRDGHSSALLVFDLDNFKQINDRCGHLEGDKVLIEFAQMLKNTLRSRDFVARTGGDEFTAFMQDIPSRTEAMDTARRIRKHVADTLGKRYAACKLGVSIGVACSTEKGISYGTLFQAADDDMYRMKFRARGGRNAELLPLRTEDEERRFLFGNAYGLVLRIDLDTGHYTIPYGAYLTDDRIPVRGMFEDVLHNALAGPIHPADRDRVRQRLSLESLRAAFEKGGASFSEVYCVTRSDGTSLWIESRFFFTQSGRTRLAYNTINDVTESRRERERCRVAEFYDLVLEEDSGGIYEVDLTRDAFRTIRPTGSLFAPPPKAGEASLLRGALRNILPHAEERDRFDDLHARAGLLETHDPVLRDEFRCLGRDGAEHWIAINILRVADPDRLLFVWVQGIDARKRLDDVSRRNDELRGLLETEDRYRIIVDQTRSLVFDWSADGSINYAPRLAILLDCGRADHGDVLSMLRGLTVHPRDQEAFRAFHDSLSARQQTEATLRLRRRDGAFIWYRVAVTLRRDAEGRLQRAVGTITDMDESVRAMRNLRYQTEHDPVTGYNNFSKFKEEAVRLLETRGDRKYSLWYCDIRNFKFINDIYGYDTGDELLNYWAEIIAEGAHPDETFGRISGDNFAMLRRYDTENDLVTRFLRCSDMLSRFEGLANRRFRVEMIAGIYRVEGPEDLLSIEDMLDRANLAQKSVKHLSGSKYALYSEEMRKQVLYEKSIEGCMEEALRRREFCLFLQPQVDIQRGNRLFGAEVLVRWNRPEYGLVPPCDFIPLFERNGFIVDLDAYVFEEACAYLASRRARGLPPLRLSVNVSRMSLAQGDFLDRYSSIRDKYGVAAGLLELECTETIVIRNFGLFREIMAALPSHGFRSAMDDFGTGYSSLNMLKEIVLDVLKLDIAFFRDTEGTPRERAVVESIVKMAHALGMATVAEGVEKEEQVGFLRSIGCNAIQGYVFSKPVPLELFEPVEASFTPTHIE